MMTIDPDRLIPTEEQWDDYVKRYIWTGKWSDDLGAPPGQAGCRVPDNIIVRHYGRPAQTDDPTLAKTFHAAELGEHAKKANGVEHHEHPAGNGKHDGPPDPFANEREGSQRAHGSADPNWRYWEPPGAKEPKEPPKLKLTFFDQLGEAKPKPWLIKGVIARGEISSWFAPPGMGKSALLTDIFVHLAGGAEKWRGFRIKAKCPGLYLALERSDLVKQRLRAYRQRDGLPALAISICGQVVDLMSANCVKLILDAIQETEQRFGSQVGIVGIDTYPKGIAAGGGDENQAKDQNIVLSNLRRVLEQAPHLHIATVGHTGKDESRGERGSNAKLADVDAQVQLSGDKIKTAEVVKANDQPTVVLTSFTLEPYVFGQDEDGDPVETFIVAKEPPKASAAPERELSPKQRLALEALAETTLVHGLELPTTDGLPRGLKAVAVQQWREELLRRRVIDPDGRNPRARFHELLTSLQAKKVIGVSDELVWAAYPATTM